MLHQPARLISSLSLSLAVSLLVGCGMAGSPGSTSSITSPAPAAKTHTISGNIHGGQQPVQFAYVQLYAVGASAYGAGATPLITTMTQADSSVQSTVQTDQYGNFSISGDYTCSGNTQLYITAVGGNPGAGTNKQLALMAALGSCSNLKSTSYIFINEVTTVAAVWALQGFIGYSATGTTASLYWNGGSNNGSGTITPATGFVVGSSSNNTQGLANAFGVASILANTTTGSAPNNNTSGNITDVEYGTINLIANILSSCINSTGGTAGDSSNCGNLFTDSTPTSTAPASYAFIQPPNGLAPQDTLQAAFLIARNPANNVATIAALAPTTPPFSPAAATSINDFTIGYDIGNSNLTTGYNTTFASPDLMAFDSYGNAWVYNLDLDGTNTSPATAPYAPYLTELDPEGNVLTTVRQYYIAGTLTTIGSLTASGSSASSTPQSSNHSSHLVIDANNNVYAEDHTSGYLFAINGSTGAGVASSGVFTANAIPTGVGATSGTSWGAGIQGLAVDNQPSGNLWVAAANAGVAPFSTSTGQTEGVALSSFTAGTPTVTASFGSGGNTYSIAIDNTSSSSFTGAPFIWTGNTGNCTGVSGSLGSTSGYGDVVAMYSTGSSKGSQPGFKGIASAGTTCTATTYPSLLSTVSVTNGGTTYSAAPIAAPAALAFDSNNGMWLANQQDAAATAGTGAGQFSTVNDLSITHLSLTYNSATSLTVSNVAQATGGGLNISGTNIGGTGTYQVQEISVDGAGNAWMIGTNTSSAGFAEFNYTNGTVTAMSPSTSYTGATCSTCSSSGSGGSARRATTHKAAFVDRSGNVWGPAVPSNGNYITVIVGAATPVYTPLLPGFQGTKP